MPSRQRRSHLGLIGHFLRQGVLEGVRQLREQTCLIEELRGLQVRQAALHVRPGTAAVAWRSAAGRPYPWPPPPGGDFLSFKRQAVDVCGQHRLHGGGDRMLGSALGQVIGAALRPPAPGSPARARMLSSRKKGLPSVRAISTGVSGARLGSLPRRVWSNASALSGARGFQPQLAIIRLAPPGVLIVGPIVHEQQQPGRG